MEKNDLYSLIRGIFRKKKLWKYRKNPVNQDIFDCNKCEEFIKEYLGQAKTEPEDSFMARILEEGNLVIDSNRYQHIVFTFFLGILVYNKCNSIKKAIDDKFCNAPEYQSALEKHQDKPFAYIWFLICLFHDLGYQFENDKKGEIRKFDTFANLRKETLLNKTPKGLFKTLSEYAGVPEYFTLELIKRYYRYRVKDMAKYDHGISGGMYLFYDLCNIRRKHYKKEEEKVQKGYWKKDLEKIFQLASSIVLCHNVFLPKIKDLKKVRKYEKYGLDELVRLAENVENGQYPYKMEDYPIFFLFCLVDSIEPIKVVKDSKCLKLVFWDIDERQIKVSTKLMCDCKDRIQKYASSLNDWLCQTETDKDGGFVTIKF